MANTLRFKRGLVATIPTAALGEPLFTTDTFDLYIGNGTGNTRFQKYIASGATTQILRGDGSLYTFPLNISSPTNGQVLKYDGTNWVNSADAGVTGSGIAWQVTYWGSSSTITGSNNLFWDATNNRLGIGTNTPVSVVNILSTKTTALSTANAFLTMGLTIDDNTAFDNAGIGGGVAFRAKINSSGVQNVYAAIDGIKETATPVDYNGALRFFTNNNAIGIPAERMRLNSQGRLLLGSTTDNGLRFQVTGDGYFSGSVGIGTSTLTANRYLNIGGANTNGIRIATSTAPSVYYTDIVNYYSSAKAFEITSGGVSVLSAAFQGYASIQLGTSTALNYDIRTSDSYFVWRNQSTDLLRLTSSGNLGLGVTPSAWGSAWDVFQIGFSPSIANFVSNTSLAITNNGYHDNTNWIYTKAAAVAQYYQSPTGQHVWYNAPSGTIGNAITFTQAMTLFATGNLAVGTTTDAGFKLDVNGTMRAGGANGFTIGAVAGFARITHGTDAANTFSFITSSNSAAAIYAAAFIPQSATVPVNGMYLGAANQINFATNTTNRLSINSSGILTYVGEYISLNANGYIRTDNVGYLTLQSGSSGFVIRNVGNSADFLSIASTGAATFSSSLTVDTNTFFVDATNNRVGIGTLVPDATFRVAGAINSTQAIFGNVDGRGLAISTSLVGGTNEAGVILNARSSVTSGTLIFQTDSTEQMRIDASGVKAATAIAIGTTPDTNKPFKILKNINGTVGINFENTSTGSSAFSAIQMGTDVSGGTAFTNLVYSSSGVSASGVYQPSGTSLINTGSGGLNFLSVSQPIRFFTSTGNGTERVRIKNEGQVHFVPLAAAPTTSVQAGDVYYDSTLAKLRCYDGIQWQDLF